MAGPRLSICFLLASAAALPQQTEPLSALIDRAFSHAARRNHAAAQPLFQQILDRATAENNPAVQAVALRGLGSIHNARGNYGDARSLLSRALDLCPSQTADPLCLARTQNELAFTEWANGKLSAARTLYEQALASFDAAGEKSERAKLLYNLAFLTSPATRTRIQRIEDAIQAATDLNDRRLLGKSHHLLGDTLYNFGDLRSSIAKLEIARSLLDTPADRGDRARVLLSLGRIYSAHLRPDLARPFYEQALAIQRELGDKQGIVFALGNLSSTARAQRRLDEAAALSAEALAIARTTGSKSLISNSLNNLAGVRLSTGDLPSSLTLASESLALQDDAMGSRYLTLGRAHLAMNHPSEALAAAEHAIQRSIRMGYEDTTAEARFLAARALDLLGRTGEAIEQMRQCLALKEKLRAKIVPTDALKRGYGASGTALFDFAVGLFFRNGLREEALVTAEMARARAFLDLLAGRSLLDKARLTKSPASDPAPADTSAEEPHILSLAHAPAPNIDDIRASAAALVSPVLIYWSARGTLFAWLVQPSGELLSARLDASAGELEDLVRAAALPAPPARKSNQSNPLVALHRLLIQPFAAALNQPSSRNLTIVAHGPLNRLSFASLRDARGRYLIENHVLAYAPSASLLGRAPPASPGQSLNLGFLLVADPAPMPDAPAGITLPALPGARKESSFIAKAVSGKPVTLLSGPDAVESSVRQSLHRHGVIHLATHGILIDDQPFDSYLALGRNGPDEPSDGRLTVREIYDLKLQPSLVVLSACRTAAGHLTGDGVAALARAFFYAGASTLVATLWDVADEPTRLLVTRFYSHLLAGVPPSRALRSAQIELLDNLRRGRVSVPTRLGPTVLDEDPVYWAGFVVLGQP
jgi:CHAT domain-containing protein/tetratricopeptide (TPR) repeat protein